jgi:hypothetical protein
MLREPIDAQSNLPPFAPEKVRHRNTKVKWRKLLQNKVGCSHHVSATQVSVSIPELAIEFKCMLQISQSFAAICNGTLRAVNGTVLPHEHGGMRKSYKQVSHIYFEQGPAHS